MAPQTAEGAEDPVAALNRDFPGQRVLIADDDEFIRCILTDMLSDTGLSMDEAQDGREAVAQCTQTHYDLILMDLQMPNMTGLEATAQIRQLPDMERTPILALTGNASVADRILCLEAGMSDFVTKPIRSEALAAILLHWLRSSQA
jgi:CheY-like chemotaxis protein